MKIYYEHHYGRMTDCDFSFCTVHAKEVGDLEEGYALENGWTRDEEENRGDLWWQTRSTRLDVSKFKFNRKTRKMTYKELLFKMAENSSTILSSFIPRADTTFII